MSLEKTQYGENEFFKVEDFIILFYKMLNQRLKLLA